MATDQLMVAWLDISKRASPRSRNTVGTDGQSIADFQLDAKSRVARLTRELRSGNFRFDPLRPHLVPKPNGKDRLICIPTVRDRIVQRALLNFLADRYDAKLANKISYGFIRNRGVKKAAADACALRASHRWVFKTDIASFFDRIDRDQLRRSLTRIIRERSLHAILFEVMSCEIEATRRNQQKRIAQLGIKNGTGLRQGMPLSPFFSNVMLADFDRSIQANGLSAVRYADDLIFFADSRDECMDLAAFCAGQLRPIGLEVPPIGPGSKSVIYQPEEPAEFLGVSLVPSGGQYQLELAKEQKDRIRDEMLALGSIDQLLARNINLTKLGTVIAQRRNGYLAAYDMCKNVGTLDSALSDLEQRVLRKIYQEGLTIDLGKLSPSARTFLGLK
ncbi:reverse transcriptase domain-containing protein [Burkholderia pseudomallei]|uniref:reverse transcriptase domain-containing protein n=2 Tax=Burkholderia pseudomallei TaxID=28450 RepID=UPI001604BABF|nr:reverse transcriptase domain-containing protein [Burkholderia pseudomallei]